MKLQRLAGHLPTALLFTTLAAAQFNTSTVSNTSSTACPSPGGVHIIAARGSTVKPQPGYGAIGILKDEVLHSVPGSTAEFVLYPATLGDYIHSDSDGVLAMRNSIIDFIARCDGSLPLVLMGYSQGAQVTADSIVGQEVAGFPTNASIPQQLLPVGILSRVAAVVLMGDPSFVTIEIFHVGNATKNGIFPRRMVAAFNEDGLASRTRSYCDFGDPYCASGNISTGLHVHLRCIQEYGTAVKGFIDGRVKAFHANGTSTPAPYTGAASGLASRSWRDVILPASVAGLLVWAS